MNRYLLGNPNDYEYMRGACSCLDRVFVIRDILKETRRKFYQNHQPEIVKISDVTTEGATTVETVND